MAAEKKLHAVGRLVLARCCDRVDNDGCLLTLKLVDSSDSSSRHAPADLRDLCVIWRDDENIVERHGPCFAETVGPGHTRRHEVRYDLGDAFGFFWGAVLIPLVLYGNVEEPRPRK